MTEAFRQALAAMDAGDLPALRQVLAAHPGVVAEREESNAGDYVGYFARATLLHHVAGNPIRGPLPANIVEVARTLIEAGADVHATCGDLGGGTVMGLVASGAQMADSGLYRPMIDLLLASGHSFASDPGVLSVCLYHTVECQRQREVGEYLASKGAKVDLVFAAALGRTDLVRSFVDGDGQLTEAAFGPFRRDAAERRARDPAAIKQEALTWACMNGRDATVAQLLDLGAEINGRAHVSGSDITPLHAAAWAGWDSTARLLLDRGADVTLLDTEHGSTPVGWAAYCRKPNVVELFRVACAGRLSLEGYIAVGDVASVEAALQGIEVNAPPAGVNANPGVLLRWAAMYGQPAVARLLLARGADPTLANPEGKTAYDFVRARELEMKELLRPPQRTDDQGS